MKRLMLVLTAVLAVVLHTRAERGTLDPTKTQLALPLPAAPTIDGVINVEEWKLGGGSAATGGGAHRLDFWRVRPNALMEDGIQGGHLGDAGTVPEDANDLSYDVVAGFDAQNLYIAVRVRDSVLTSDSAEADSNDGNTWMDDSVEVFIDGDNSNFAFRDTSGTNPDVVGTGGQFVITVNNAYRDAEAGNPTFGPNAAWHARVAPRTEVQQEIDVVVGYDAEFRISLATLGNPKPGDVIGFTVGVNDDDDGAAGDAQIMWIGMPHTESTYGNLLLQGHSYTAPKVATAPTVDGVIHAAEYAGAEQIKVDPSTGIWELGNNMDDNWSADDLSYSAWIVHAADAVYVAVDVLDNNVVADSAEEGSENGSTWEDDSVDIYFDADHSRDFGRGARVGEGQYVFTASGAHRDAEANNPTFGEGADWFAARSVKSTTRGYQVEFKIMKSMLVNPADGKTMGFFLDVNDDDGANRKSQLGWSGASHSEFTYGTLTLAGGAAATLQIASISRIESEVVLTIQSPNSAGVHKVQKSSSIAPASWSDVSGVTFTVNNEGRVVARFPAPVATEFYRISLP